MFQALQLAALALPVADRVLDELQRAGLAEVRDREDRLEDSLQPRVLAILRRRVDLQKPLVRALLHLDQVRDRDGGVDLREVDTLTAVAVRRDRLLFAHHLRQESPYPPATIGRAGRGWSCTWTHETRSPRPLRPAERTASRDVLPDRGRGERTAAVALYFSSTLAPASPNFFLISSASALDTPSFTVFGAPSTRSLASFRPRLVTSRTTLMTLIFLSPTSLRTTSNVSFASATAAAPAPAPGAPATNTGAAAAAETPNSASSSLTSSATSSIGAAFR